MKYLPSDRSGLNIFFTYEEVRQIAAITDYVNRLYPRLDEVLLECSQEYAQEQAALWKRLALATAGDTIEAGDYKLLSYKVLEVSAEGIALSIRDGNATLLGLTIMYSAYDEIPENDSLSVSKDQCRRMQRDYYDVIREDLVAYGATPYSTTRRAT